MKVLLFIFPLRLSDEIRLSSISPAYNDSRDYCLFDNENKIKANLRFILIFYKNPVRSQNYCRKIAVKLGVIVKLRRLMLLFDVIAS